MLKVLSFFHARWVYLLFFTDFPPIILSLPLIILGFSNLTKEERNVRVISNELNDTLRVVETIKVPSLDYIESLIQTI